MEDQVAAEQAETWEDRELQVQAELQALRDLMDFLGILALPEAVVYQEGVEE